MGSVPVSDRPAWLGAKLQAVTPEMAEAMGQRQLRGAIVAWVLPDRAGTEGWDDHAGDVILRFDGKTFSDERALLRDITARKPGDEVPFTVWRNGQEIELKVTLETWPKTIWERNAATPLPKVHLTVPPDLGLSVAQLTDELRAANRIRADTKGVLVTEVAARFRCRAAGRDRRRPRACKWARPRCRALMSCGRRSTLRAAKAGSSTCSCCCRRYSLSPWASSLARNGSRCAIAAD